jgi:hypothetical protein
MIPILSISCSLLFWERNVSLGRWMERRAWCALAEGPERYRRRDAGYADTGVGR